MIKTYLCLNYTRSNSYYIKVAVFYKVLRKLYCLSCLHEQTSTCAYQPRSQIPNTVKRTNLNSTNIYVSYFNSQELLRCSNYKKFCFRVLKHIKFVGEQPCTDVRYTIFQCRQCALLISMVVQTKGNVTLHVVSRSMRRR